MAATITPQLPSGGTDGKAIDLSATTSGTAITLHTCVSGTTSMDELYVWVYNVDSSSRTLNLSFGATADAAPISIPPNVGLVPVCFGSRLNNGQVLKAWADVASKLKILINVNRFVP